MEDSPILKAMGTFMAIKPRKATLRMIPILTLKDHEL